MLEHYEEILNVSTIESASPSRTRSVLSHNQVIQWTKAKVQVYFDSVLCLGIMMEAKVQLQDGKVKWKNSKCPLLTKNWQESVENQLNWSDIFSQDRRHCRFFRKSWMICENGTSNLKNSQTRSSSCQFSTTSIGQEKETMEFVEKVKEYAKRVSQGHCSRSWRRKEVVWNSSLHTWRTMGHYSHSNGGMIQRYRSSSIQEYQCFES